MSGSEISTSLMSSAIYKNSLRNVLKDDWEGVGERKRSKAELESSFGNLVTALQSSSTNSIGAYNGSEPVLICLPGRIC